MYKCLTLFSDSENELYDLIPTYVNFLFGIFDAAEPKKNC
jgi:hypothetical protein